MRATSTLRSTDGNRGTQVRIAVCDKTQKTSERRLPLKIRILKILTKENKFMSMSEIAKKMADCKQVQPWLWMSEHISKLIREGLVELYISQSTRRYAAVRKRKKIWTYGKFVT